MASPTKTKPQSEPGDAEHATSFDDAEFVAQAYRGGMFEIESSLLALEKSSSERTKEFAHEMIEAHGQSNRELQSIAELKHLDTPARLDHALQQELDALRQSDGHAFDRRFHEAQLAVHRDAVALFQRGSLDCRDEELRAFAERTLPTLRRHLAQLEHDDIDAPKQGSR